jgi:hypothetical protein
LEKTKFEIDFTYYKQGKAYFRTIGFGLEYELVYDKEEDLQLVKNEDFTDYEDFRYETEIKYGVHDIQDCNKAITTFCVYEVETEELRFELVEQWKQYYEELGCVCSKIYLSKEEECED